MATALIMLLCPVVTHAYEYVNLSGTGFTTSYLISRCSGKHVKIDGETTTLNVSENLNIKEIFAPNTHVNVVLSNHAKFRIDQEIGVTMSAMNVKSLTVSGEGYIYITGNDVAIGLHGGQLDMRSTTVGIKSLSGNAIAAKKGSEIVINNSVVDISSPQLAVASWTTGSSNDSPEAFQVSGDRSHVTVKGNICKDFATAVNKFNVSGGYVSITDNPNAASCVVFASNVNLTGGKIYINQTKNWTASVDCAGFECDNFNASNCEVEINSTAMVGIKSNDDVNISYASVKTYARNGYGIYAYGDVTLAGNQEDRRVLAVGGITGIWAKGFIDIKNRNLLARGNSSYGINGNGIYFTPQEGCLYEAFSPIEPIKTTASGATIHLLRPVGVAGTVPGLEGNYTGSLMEDETCFGFYTTPYKGYVKVERPDIGNITGTGNSQLLDPGGTKRVHPGDIMQIDLTPLQQYLTYPNPVIKVYIYRHDESGGTLIKEQVATGTTFTYTFTEEDVSHFVTAEVEADAYNSTLNAGQYYVFKSENWSQPVQPQLQLSAGKVQVTNARANQEYLLFSTAQFQEFLQSPNDDSWWTNAHRPTANGTYTMNNTISGELNNVVTRYKATLTTYPGLVHDHAAILVDNTTLTRGLEVKLSPVGNNFVDMEYLGGKVTYTTKKNGVIKMTINPVPSNATDFTGILGSMFSITHYSTMGTDYVELYANQACTQPLNANTRYKTVYVKPIFEGNNLNIGSVNFDEIATQVMGYLNVSDDNGKFKPYTLIVNHDEDIYAYKDQDVTNIPFSVFPQRATLDGDVTVNFRSVTGLNTPPRQDHRPTFTVDKANKLIHMIAAEKGAYVDYKYNYTLVHSLNGTDYGYDYFAVNIIKHPITELRANPAQVTVSPGESVGVTVISTPEGVWSDEYANVTFSISDESVATVTYNGSSKIFTIKAKENAVLGSTATLTIGALGTDATTTVTVIIDGETYPLWVGGTQVTSVNCDDVLGDGKVSYVGGPTGGTLSLNGATIGGQGISSSIPTLTIGLTGQNRVNNKVTLEGNNNSISGNGKLQINGTDDGLTTVNLSISDNAKVEADGETQGVYVSQDLLVQGEESYITGFAAEASFYVMGNLHGIITEPDGAYHNPTTGAVVFSSGEPVFFETVRITADPSFLRGDLNGDGNVNTGDISELYRALMNGINDPKYDLNGDGNVNAGDVSELYLIILGN